MRVVTQSTYVDGCEHVAVYDVEEPPELTEAFWDDVVFPLTGDGNHTNVNATYSATIVDAANPTFIGRSQDWQG